MKLILLNYIKVQIIMGFKQMTNDYIIIINK